MKSWHERAKKENPREYYITQYERFKKIGGYKYKTQKGEAVRNILERDFADLLNKYGIDYDYEPLVKVGSKFYFPDFLINDFLIIECTMWRGEQKAYALKKKLEKLNKKYRAFVLIPKALYKYYRTINSTNLILGLDNFASVAQSLITFKKI